ncbi:response regulator transcription factor [Kutzneria buriramensis]|uniref:DNA-binding NarL/FixJ family response regulator n=1 Tax=Kutzneria buriramensis TaxID=1045776 RepID=A0A3E0HAM7_9PSEU|nr:response regulator transcription factor [Kutzneria buriramensis]REH41094.1 DNA-binding NarL/FixJ family response regulator [Kutzneria buriramensis]
MRIVIAEDAVLLRHGLTLLLTENGHEVVDAVDDAEKLLRSVADHAPDVAVVDVRMPPTHTDEGLRAALVIRQQWPATAVLVLSQYVEERYASDLITGELNGVGYLLKDRVADVEEFLSALDRVGAGGTVFDPEVVSQIVARSRRRDPLATLTPRERQAFSLMAEGRSNAGIAEGLVITEGAVEKYVAGIFNKLGLPKTSTEHRRVLAVLRYLEG